MPQQAVLIIKHGFSETCEYDVTRTVSFGDVFRCTCLLEDFRDCHVTWITAPAARDLLAENHLIDQLILADTPDQLPPQIGQQKYDSIINLEKQPDWCAFAADLPGRNRYGFKDWTSRGEDCFYPESASALSSALQRQYYRPLQETLFKTIARSWTGQRYVLGYRPEVPQIFDIGLNHHVGPKWPHKIWPRQYWCDLYDALSTSYTVSWQQSLNSIRHYIDWLASCRLIITCDSLGLHLAVALNRKIVALFGPTPPQQIHLYGCGIKLTPPCDRSCIPCFSPECTHANTCLEYLTVDMVVEAVASLMSPQPQRDYLEIFRTTTSKSALSITA